MATIIRAAALTDVDRMHQIRMSVRENQLRDPTRVTVADYARYLAAPGASWVAEMDGRVAGFAIADVASRSIWALFVDPEYEGRGLGRQLLSKVVEYLFASSAEPINLSTEPGTRAERLYLRSGWTHRGSLSTGESWLSCAAETRRTAPEIHRVYQLAQLNIARMTAPIESPVYADFVGNLDRINGLTESAPGFVWRLKTAEGNALALRTFGDEYLVNISTWTDIPSLHNYVYRTAHAEIMKRRKEWFSHMGEAYTVLWWVPAGHEPSADEAKARLLLLRERGPTPAAFTFKQHFPSAQADA